MSFEGVIQAACIDALSHFCAGEGMKFNGYAPYANQQGGRRNQFCADLVGVVSNSSLVLLEIKELILSSLAQFKDDQHQMLLNLERAGIPAAYCYNNVEVGRLASHDKEEDWARRTLMALNRSIPSELPGRQPFTEYHTTLYEWLAMARVSGGADNFSRFGALLQRSIRPDFLRNWFLTLVYSPASNTVFSLDQAQLKDMYEWMSELSKQPNQSQVSAQMRRMQQAAGIFPPHPLTTSFNYDHDDDNSPSP